MAKKTIVMPVGEFRGKKKSMDADKADSIINTFGEYVDEAAASVDDVAEMRAEITSLEKQLKDETARADDAEKLLEEATGEGGGDE